MAEAPKSPASKHTSLDTPGENNVNGDLSVVSNGTPSREYMPNLPSSASAKLVKKNRLENVVRTMKTKQFRKIVACCLQAACAGWNGRVWENDQH